MTVYDLHTPVWGHNAEFVHRHFDGTWRAVLYLSDQVRTGDYVLVSDHDLTLLRYRVVSVDHRRQDPGDQHFVDLYFDPEDRDAGHE